MGRRWGKTLMAGTYALACANHGGAVAWIVPTYKNARPVWRFCERMVAHLDGIVRINRTDRLVEFPSGGWLAIYSADNDVAIRGEAFDVSIVDEAAQISPETYTDVILPTLADRDGRSLLISTPKGLNWFHTEFINAKGDGVDRAAWQAPTAANPMPQIQRAAVLARERVSERAYLQEWLAEFVSDGQVFRKVKEACRAKPQAQRVDGHEYVMGVDWGKVDDATVFSVGDATTFEQVHVERMNRVDYHLQLGRLAILAQKFRPRLIVTDAIAMGAPLLEQCGQMGLPVWGWTATNATKAVAVESLSLGFEQMTLAILDDEAQRGELLAYDTTRTPSGLSKYGAPEGMHDDYVSALILMWMAMCAGDQRPVAREFRVEA